jgi:hypothetical protein
MRNFKNYCFALPFSRPQLQNIRGHIMSICYKERALTFNFCAGRFQTEIFITPFHSRIQD